MVAFAVGSTSAASATDGLGSEPPWSSAEPTYAVSLPGPPSSPSDASAQLPPPVPAPGPLDGYNVLIADRGNNRLLLITADKKILWEYDFSGIRAGTGPDDAFFADEDKSVVVNLEYQQVVEVIDIASKIVTWQYGQLGKRGSVGGLLNYPDDAYKLPNGDLVVADIRNCRILELAPDKHIVRQAGQTDRCGSGPTTLASPNGDKPLPNGHLLVSTITDHSLIELDEKWTPILRLKLPLRYPSDPQPTVAGNFLVADYVRPGRIIEIDRGGRVLWDYTGAGDGQLNRPSLAIELPDGNILANDDYHHRVVVIDKANKQIIWQYGVTGKPGSDPGYLSIPDGLDIKKAVP